MNISNTWWKVVLIAATSFFIGALAFWASDKYLLSPKPEKQESAVKVEEAKKKPQPTKAVKSIEVGSFEPLEETGVSPKILSVSKKGKIAVYDPATKKTTNLSVKSSGGGGWLYRGTSSPFLSPSHKLIAYVNAKDGNLWIVDTNGKNNTKISTQVKEANDLYFGTSLLVSGWSSNDRFLVYYVQINDESMGHAPVQGTFNPAILEGFYVADLTKGKVYFIPNLPNFVDFLPKSNLAIFVTEDFENKETTLYTYDLTSKKIKKVTREKITGGSSHQFSFAADKKHYAYVIAKSSPTDASKLIYAALNNTGRKEIATGTFAVIQRPHISPDGKLIAYMKRNSNNICSSGTSGCPMSDLVIYNIKTKKKKVLNEVKGILYWYDNTRIVVLGGPYSGPWTLQLVNKDTGTVKKISDDEILRNQ